jgi:ATP-binding cassette subfamily B protein
MLGSILLLFLGGIFVLEGKMSVGEVVAFYVFFAFLYDPIRTIINIYGQFSQVEASLTRINSILENKSEIVEKESAITISDSFGEYQFEDVWFSYEEDDHYAIRGISFHVKPGERIAILGATGSGKSTFINLIPRFYDPTRGKILYDGVDTKDLKIDDYRRQIGVVSQDIFLFSRSIRENIAYGLGEKVKQEDIEKVAKIAAIHNFIITLPEGYKSKVGERGQTLSGGQKQRIAIARALLLNPRVLILDDSLSAVDIDTEAQIQKALDTLYTDRTTFVITQRISTVQNCNRILVLDDGKILEIGTHEELYQQGGVYTKIYDTMYRAQTKEKERKIKSQVEVETPFKDLAPSDALTVKGLYEQKYPDEQKRVKAEEKTLKKLEKAQEKEEKKLNKELGEEEKKKVQDSTKNIEKSMDLLNDSVKRIEPSVKSKYSKKRQGDEK